MVLPTAAKKPGTHTLAIYRVNGGVGTQGLASTNDGQGE
jgi:hypothetical protein